jgi:endoglucanase
MNNLKVAFEIMNEPHDIDLNLWAATVQATVTAIRNIGATNIILITGIVWSDVYNFAYNFDAATGPVANVTNPDGSFNGLVFSVHQYIDGAGGTLPICTVDARDAITTTASKLTALGGRQAMLTEFGAGNNQGCIDLFCPLLDVIK